MNLPHFAYIFVHRMGEATGTLLSVEDKLGSMFRVGGSAPKRAVSRCSVNTRYLLDLAVLFSELLRRSWLSLTRSLSFSLSKGSKFNNALLGPSGFGMEIIGMMGPPESSHFQSRVCLVDLHRQEKWSSPNCSASLSILS